MTLGNLVKKGREEALVPNSNVCFAVEVMRCETCVHKLIVLQKFFDTERSQRLSFLHWILQAPWIKIG